MKNRIIAVIFSICLSFLLITPSVETKAITVTEIREGTAFVQNGDFETLNTSGYPVKWARSGTSITVDTSGGSNAIRLSGSNIRITQDVVGAFVAGQEYVLSARVKLVSYTGKGAGTKLEFYTPAGKQIASASNKSHNYYRTTGDWADYRYTFKMPENVAKIVLYVRIYDTGDVLWDDVQMTGPAYVEVIQKETPWEGCENLLMNGDFESQSGWILNTPGNVSFPAETGRGTVLKITNTDSTKNPYISYTITDVIPGVRYQVSALLKTEAFTGDGPGFKAEFNQKNENNPNARGPYCGETTGPKLGETNGEWKEVLTDFTVPISAHSLTLFVRLYGAGTVYYDDIACYPVGERVHASVFNECFIYSEWTHNDVDISLYNADVKYISCKVLGDDTTKPLDEKMLTVTGSAAVYTYETALLQEKGKAYTLQLIYEDKNHEEIGRFAEEIYRYDRPKYLTEDGYFIGADNILVKPVIAYHVYKSDLARCAAAGINVVQSENKDDKATPKNLTYLKEFMDEAWFTYGLRTAVTLYAGNVSAGHSDNFSETIACVEEIKNHPGLFCYMLQDEPFLPSRLKNRTADEIALELKTISKAIRDIDDKHPLYICEQSRSTAHLSERMVDVLVGDPYPQTNPMDTFVYGIIKSFKDVTRNRKPVYAILQAWEYNGWEPEANDIRHMAYQTLFAKAEGIGYYDFSQFDTASPLWERTCYPGVTALADGEYEDAYKAFVTGEYPTFNEESGNIGANYWYKAYVKNNELYYVVMNLRDAQKAVNIPLTSFDNTITIGTYNGTASDAETTKNISGNGTIAITLEPHQTLRIQITPSVAVDYSTLTTSRFHDLTAHAWAKAQIDSLANHGYVTGVSERKFAPDASITKADFAVFLVRAMELSADTGANFDDVAAFAPFEKEVGIAGTLGIFKGEDNLFYPYAAMTRQELLTVCRAAMAAVLPENVPDNAAADVAWQMRINITDGNIDATENEFITRAEAAVILERMLKWKENAQNMMETSVAKVLGNAEEKTKQLVFEGFLGDASMAGEKLENGTWQYTWKNGDEDFVMFCNGTDSAKQISAQTAFATASPCAGVWETAPCFEGGSLTVMLSPGEFALFQLYEEAVFGIYKNNVLYQNEIPSAAEIQGAKGNAVYVAVYTPEKELLWMKKVTDTFSLPSMKGEYLLYVYDWGSTQSPSQAPIMRRITI